MILPSNFEYKKNSGFSLFISKKDILKSECLRNILTDLDLNLEKLINFDPNNLSNSELEGVNKNFFEIFNNEIDCDANNKNESNIKNSIDNTKNCVTSKINNKRNNLNEANVKNSN